jgi:hypothetical protein
MIDGNASVQITQNYGWYTLLFQSANWHIIGSGSPRVTSNLFKRSDVIYVSNTSTAAYHFAISGTAIVVNDPFVQVYLNRMLLRPGEYTVTNSNTITINVSLNLDDELEIVSFG